MNPFLKALHILSWIPVGLIRIFLVLMGLIIVPVVIGIGAANKERWPEIFWLWGNKQEDPPFWWTERAKLLPTFRWYAIRNPVNNLRYIFKDPDIVYRESNWDRNKNMEARPMLRTRQAMAYRWMWSGPFAGYRRVWLNNYSVNMATKIASADSYSEIWFGWKVGSKVPGLGFTTQVRLKRKIGQ